MKNHFYFVNDLEENYVNQSCSVFHGYGEVKQVDSDVVVISAHSPQDASGESASIETKIVYTGGSVADVTYNFKQAGLTGGAAAYNGNHLGKASATELDTGFVNTSDEFKPEQSQCKKRDLIWQSSWLGALYDTKTNERLKLTTRRSNLRYALWSARPTASNGGLPAANIMKVIHGVEQ